MASQTENACVTEWAEATDAGTMSQIREGKVGVRAFGKGEGGVRDVWLSVLGEGGQAARQV